MKTEVRKDIRKHVELITKFKKDFKIRKSNNFSEIIMTHGNQRLLFNENSDFTSGLFLFKMVKKDVVDYIDENGAVNPLDELPVNYKNKDYDSKNKTIGVDLNHAYWRVAYLKEYITENTYMKGMASDKYKPIRLSALSNLGRSKTYDVYEKGKFIHQEKTESNQELLDLYNDIRYTTYGIMKELADKLGNDFHSWKTDCIYFKDLVRNKKLVTETFDSYDLLWKYEEV